MKKFVLSIIFAAISVLFSGRVYANTAPIAWEGSASTEPQPLEDCPIEVEKERLEFKLESRKYSYTLHSNIKAVYSLHNPTSETYGLTAVFPVIIRDGDQQNPLFQKVRLNGKEIPYTAWLVEADQDDCDLEMLLSSLPLEEMLKRRKPFIPQDDFFDHGPYPVLMLEFEVEIPPGKTSRLEILTKTAAFMERDPLFTYGTSQARYTFHYYLSPARYWAGFKNLDIVLKTSSIAPILKESNLDFHWAGSRRYRFHSDTLPEGELTFTVQYSFWYAPLRWIAILAIGIGTFVCTRKLKRRYMSSDDQLTRH